MEVREVGMVEVDDLFGSEAVVAAWAIDAVIDLLPAADAPPSRRTAPSAPTALCGIDRPPFTLHTADPASLANRLEVIARLVSNRMESSTHG
jgi:serine kinase of HPr protein (carbohydrate metabolism regulator)